MSKLQSYFKVENKGIHFKIIYIYIYDATQANNSVRFRLPVRGEKKSYLKMILAYFEYKR